MPKQEDEQYLIVIKIKNKLGAEKIRLEEKYKKLPNNSQEKKIVDARIQRIKDTIHELNDDKNMPTSKLITLLNVTKLEMSPIKPSNIFKFFSMVSAGQNNIQKLIDGLKNPPGQKNKQTQRLSRHR